MRVYSAWLSSAVTVACLSISASSGAADTLPGARQTSAVIARLDGREVTLRELDQAGGRPVYDAALALYEERVRALYQLLSDEVLAREARHQSRTVDQLMDQEVNAFAPAATDVEVDAFLKERQDGKAQDPRSRREAQLYLTLKRRADRKRTYVESLFDRFGVRVSLEGPPSAPIEEVRGDLAPALGPDNAPVTLIVFSDYRCQYCRSLANTLTQLTKKFPDDVRLVWRQFPVQRNSQPLAEAALCAADQGRFSQLHDQLFSISGNGSEQLDQAAERAGLTLEPFRECMQQGRHAARVAEDLKEGQRLGIQGTPTLFVNGVRLRGAQTLDRLDAQVREALSEHHKLAGRRP